MPVPARKQRTQTPERRANFANLITMNCRTVPQSWTANDTRVLETRLWLWHGSMFSMVKIADGKFEMGGMTIYEQPT